MPDGTYGGYRNMPETCRESGHDWMQCGDVMFGGRIIRTKECRLCGAQMTRAMDPAEAKKEVT